ncbi:Exodeoxyribonuclease 7 small subunit, partial [Clarias magur]
SPADVSTGNGSGRSQFNTCVTADQIHAEGKGTKASSDPNRSLTGSQDIHWSSMEETFLKQ